MSTIRQRSTREAQDPNLGPPKLLTVQQAAQQLGIGEATTWALVSSGQLRSLRIGKLRRIPAGAVDDFIALRLAEGAA